MGYPSKVSTYLRMTFALFAERVVVFVRCSYQNSGSRSVKSFEGGVVGFVGFATHVASLAGCGSKNSKMKLPSYKLKGPEITGSSRGDLGAMLPLVADKSLCGN